MRRAILLAVAVLAVTLAQAPAVQAADLPIYGCSGYATTASYTTAAGNLYESKKNVCVGISTDGQTYAGVERRGCYRNGQPYGDGTGGCRWTGTVLLQWDYGDGNGWQDAFGTAKDWCNTCGGIYIQDSGRQWSVYTGKANASAARGKSAGGQVRFYLADGSTVLLNEASRWGQGIFVP
jgi:hypothetical protein